MSRREHNLTVRLSGEEYTILGLAAVKLSAQAGVRVGVGAVLRQGGLAKARDILGVEHARREGDRP